MGAISDGLMLVGLSNPFAEGAGLAVKATVGIVGAVADACGTLASE